MRRWTYSAIPDNLRRVTIHFVAKAVGERIQEEEPSTENVNEYCLFVGWLVA